MLSGIVSDTQVTAFASLTFQYDITLAPPRSLCHALIQRWTLKDGGLLLTLNLPSHFVTGVSCDHFNLSVKTPPQLSLQRENRKLLS